MRETTNNKQSSKVQVIKCTDTYSVISVSFTPQSFVVYSDIAFPRKLLQILQRELQQFLCWFPRLLHFQTVWIINWHAAQNERCVTGTLGQHTEMRGCGGCPAVSRLHRVFFHSSSSFIKHNRGFIIPSLSFSFLLLLLLCRSISPLIYQSSSLQTACLFFISLFESWSYAAS